MYLPIVRDTSNQTDLPLLQNLWGSKTVATVTNTIQENNRDVKVKKKLRFNSGSFKKNIKINK